MDITGLTGYNAANNIKNTTVILFTLYILFNLFII